MRVYVDVDPAKDPAPVDLQTSVTLRNLNHLPVPQLTCQGGSSGHVLCDASGSIDPDSESRSFAWKMDGSTISGTSYNLDKAGLAWGSSHIFTVTVTDSSGASSSASQTVLAP